MAKNNTITVANAFSILSAILEGTDETTIKNAIAAVGIDATPDAFAKKFATMNRNAHKSSKRPHKPSKASIINANDARCFASAHKSGDIVTLSDVTAVIPTRVHSQACTPVINVLLADGTIERSTEKVGGHVSYIFK